MLKFRSFVVVAVVVFTAASAATMSSTAAATTGEQQHDDCSTKIWFLPQMCMYQCHGVCNLAMS